MVVCELGTLDDLVSTAARCQIDAVHFSGHGGPSVLQFETEENEPHAVQIEDLVQRLRTETPSGLPQLFYLSCCHGNTPLRLPDGSAQASAAHLHREGIAEVIGYFGPIAQGLSTAAEEAFYSAVAAGRTTRFATRQARIAMVRADDFTNGPEIEPWLYSKRGPRHPFAWSQLVLYRRGPEHALSLPRSAQVTRNRDEALHRTFQEAGNRRFLINGFIGRRTELHRIRRRLRTGQRVFVFHGLGGVGKTTLALQLVSMLATRENVCPVWCAAAPQRSDLARSILRRLIDYGSERFGNEIDDLAVRLGRQYEGDISAQLRAVLDTLLTRIPRVVIYLDNLESLMKGPDSDRPGYEFAEWISPDLKDIWNVLVDCAENSDRLYLLASCRYLNRTIPRRYQFPVSPMSRDSLFRLTKWFPALRCVSARNRARLAERLAGHPRAVEFANGLVAFSLEQWEMTHGERAILDVRTLSNASGSR